MTILLAIGALLTIALIWAIAAGVATWLIGRGLLTPAFKPYRIAKFLAGSLDWAMVACGVAFGGLLAVLMAQPKSARPSMRQHLREQARHRGRVRETVAEARRQIVEHNLAADGVVADIRIEADNSARAILEDAERMTLAEARAEWERGQGRTP